LALLIVSIVARGALGLAATDPLLAPVNALIDGLNRLDDGTVPELFKPARRTGRPPLPQGDASVHAAALYTVRNLVEQGTERKQARVLVAGDLNEVGYQTQKGKISERTVREWHEAADADRASETATLLAQLLSCRPTVLSGLSPAGAERRLLGALQDTVHSARANAVLK
jgi:hypothetical protein